MKRTLLAAAIIAMVASAVGCKPKTDAPGNMVIVDKALSDAGSNFYVDFSQYPEDMHLLPIGVFDSGTGGLTVLEKLVALDQFDNITGAIDRDSLLDFAGEHFIYLADQANMPYGNYDAEGNSEYLRELAVKDAIFLLQDRFFINSIEDKPSGEKPRVKIIVIGCNTATAYGLKHISSMLEQSNSGVKVIGVINAGVRATLDELNVKENSQPMAIGVLATPGTIASGAYEATIREELKNRGITSTVDVVSQSGYGFAEAVDSEPDYVNKNLFAPRSSYRGPALGTKDNSIKQELLKAYNFDYSDFNVLARRNPDGTYAEIQLNDASNYARFNLVSLFERHRASGASTPIRAIILGCTHYPFQIETLEAVVEELRNFREDGRYPYRDLIAEDLQFIDPAYYTAIECYSTLRKDGNLALRITPTTVDGYISVPSSTLPDDCLTDEGHLTYDFKFGRKPGTEDITTKQVPFSRANIDSSNLARIEARLPYCYKLIEPSL